MGERGKNGRGRGKQQINRARGPQSFLLDNYQVQNRKGSLGLIFRASWCLKSYIRHISRRAFAHLLPDAQVAQWLAVMAIKQELASSIPHYH